MFTRFFGNHAIVWMVQLQRAADNRLRTIIGDGDRFFLIARGFGIGDQVLFLHAAAELDRIAHSRPYRLHILAFF